MFKNRALEVKVVKNPKQDNPEAPTKRVQERDLLMYNYIVKDQVKNAAIVVGGAVCAKALLTTLGEIAIITAKAKLK
jgi:hypothetical protein